jgi:hypothetical protein
MRRTTGAKGDDSADEIAAAQAALDAAERNGGGVVLLLPGKYRFLGSLTIPPDRAARRRPSARVAVSAARHARPRQLGHTGAGNGITAFIQGQGDFGVENLNILAVYPPLIIAAPFTTKPLSEAGWDTALATDRYAENVFVRSCRIVHEPTYDCHSRRADDPLLVGEGLLKQSRFWQLAAIALRGDHMEAPIVTSGTGVVFCGTRHGLIVRNTLRVGSAAKCHSLQERP